MPPQNWNELVLANINKDQVWELFHENSKISQYDHFLTKEEVMEKMEEFHESIPYQGYAKVDIPEQLTSTNSSLEETMLSRFSSRKLIPKTISLRSLGALLHYSYGNTRENKASPLPRFFRATPSGGGLYPLEIFFFSKNIKELRAGIYHFSPSMKVLNLLQEGDKTEEIALGVINPSLIRNACVVFFITAIFERTIFKYGDRGYRFILLEAGHLAQNLNLLSTAMGLGSVNIGGFFDRKIDDLLMLDGLTHSTIYLVAIGGNRDSNDEFKNGESSPS